ncbi:hypothetical protein GYMLUDRAFT_885155 [Collybiopsis luxurians FD-317 M1]|uniref:Uncharacterized protein n=1 Tax=Collybiopsis luxurians FD-317 M1 TaxID=944289 RepID=A0A0D0AX48_9AGAR|nr:hypothetical protein GYMLUDRAFT_885155 [Collybiopsis luxurians FD-317 M1]
MNGIERSEEGMQAQFGAIADLSNGLIFDWRVFRLHGPVFLTRVNEQAMCEGNHWDAWPPHIGPEELKKKALERLRNEGWERTRPALTLVVRAWIIIGFLKGKLEVNHTYAIEAFKNALNVINWGRQLWKDVPKEQRGTMFDITFRRGVWNLYIFSLMDNLYYDKNNMDLLETIYKEANAIIKDVDEDTYPYDEPEIGFPLAFYDCIKANALACKALYHKTISESKTLDKKTLKKHWMATMNFYIEAADALPEDDENHPWYLNCAYVYMEPLNVSTSRVMKILERIRLSVPKMMKIWGPSMHMRQEKNNRHRVQVYARLLKIEELGKELLAKKTITPNGPFDWSAVNRIGQIED